MMDPQSANDYDDRGARAVYSVLLEIGQVLGAYRDRFVVIGGSVPWLLFPQAQSPHIGTLDVDLSLDAEALGDGEYKGLVEMLEGAGYQRAAENMKVFQLRRIVQIDAGEPVAVIIDLLMPREVRFDRNKPPLLANFAVQKMDGAAVAMRDFILHKLGGRMPDGRPNSVELRVASIPAFLVMKGYALRGRDKRKDAYDIYFSIRQFDDGPLALQGYQCIAEKFAMEGGFGPVTVREFMAESAALGDMTTAQVELDAFRQVRAWLDALGF